MIPFQAEVVIKHRNGNEEVVLTDLYDSIQMLWSNGFVGYSSQKSWRIYNIDAITYVEKRIISYLTDNQGK